MLHNGHCHPTLAAHIITSTTAWQACLGMVMLTNCDAVQVTIWVDLCSTQKTIIYEAALGSFHKLTDACRHQRFVESTCLTHCAGKLIHDRSQSTKFKHGHQVRSNGFGRQHGCQHGDAWADKRGRAV